MISGIYQIINKVNGNIYIGSASYINRRINNHFYNLKNNKHHSIHLQRAWNKYGKEVFEFQVIEECEKDKLIEREQYYIDNLKPKYNICINARSRLGVKSKEGFKSPFKGIKRSEEFKKKISESSKGKIISIEHRLKFSKPVIQFNKEMKEINKFFSIREAERITGIAQNNISLVCRNIRKTAGKFIWQFQQQ